MIVKIIKGVWFLSLLTAIAVLLYSYASFPEDIQVREGAQMQTVTRNGFFYAILGLLAVFNSLVFVVTKIMGEQDPFFRIWFYGLVVLFNLFIVVSLQFFNLYNSAERFDYDRIGYIIYGSVGLILLWALLLPLKMILKKFSRKQIVIPD
ncbi:MAG: hypothetical protein JNK10_10780 [Cyclobacteriaceae bacterium]|nr:hypothetical protein [Cyclobacteriaceae bacterium]